jgi:ATP-binding cassette subfamily B protein
MTGPGRGAAAARGAGVVPAARALLTQSWQTNRAKTAAAAGLVLAAAGAGPSVAWGLKRLIDSAVAGRVGPAAAAGLVVAVLAVAALTLGHFAHVLYSELAEGVLLHYDEQLIRISNGSPGIEHHELTAYADELSLVEREIGHVRAAMQALMTGAGLVLTMVLTGALLATVHPLLLLLPVVAVPPLVAGRAAERVGDRARAATAERRRLALGLFRLGTSASAGMELRVYRLRRELRGRHAALWRAIAGELWRAEARAATLRAGGQAAFAVGFAAAVLLVVHDAVVGRRTVGDIVLAVVLAVQVNQQVAQAVGLLRDLQRMATLHRRLRDLRDFVARPAGTPDPRPRPAGALPARLRTGIDLAGVSFTYAGSAGAVLRDVNLRLPAGRSVAVVGENGAGKSTLVKLLCGFYRPTAGRVLVDGVDLCAVPLAHWRQRVTAGFQDFTRFEFVARQSVGVGDVTRESSEPAVLAALERADATAVVRELPAGLRTQLGKSYADGVQPSGGQWQRLALGRAFMRDEPLLVVLDEPTAALDAEAEHRLFERYHRQARRLAAANGAVTVLVSHRFSTVRMADLIIVLAGGRVVEVGDHGTLMAQGGLYAELYALQAGAYR